MINLNHLRIFYYAVKYQNFTRAAQKLCISQPAVTAQIKMFEDQLKLKLFKKRGRKIYPTAESDLLYEYARKVFETEEAFENAVEALHGLKKGILRLGAAKTYARYLLPYLMSRFHREFPNIQINVSEGSSREMINSLLEFKNEIALIAKSETSKEIRFVPFIREKVVLILPPDHRLAGKKAVDFKELCREKIMMKEIGSGTRLLVDKLFAENGCKPDVLMETSNQEFIKQLVQQGEGISFLSSVAVQTELAQKKLSSIDVKRADMSMDIHVAYVEGDNLSRAANAFIEYTEKFKPGSGSIHRSDEIIKLIKASE
jgi:DNA-binding transcriptional LysR family regulator